MKRIKTILISSLLFLTSFIGIVNHTKAPAKVNADANIPSGQVKDEIVDIISVSDLTISASNGTYSNLTNQTMVPANINNDATFSFSGENVNKNLVFKFKYDVVDTNPSDSNAVNIYLDVSDNKYDGLNSLWIRGDGTHFSRYSDSKFNYKALPALTEGMHDIEYGRIALLDASTGDPTGNYYVYYKLDNVLVRDDINPYDGQEHILGKTTVTPGVDKMDNTIFLNFSAGNTSNKIYDANLSYETPQYVSVSELKYGGSFVGDSIIDKSTAYTYDTANQPTNKSTVFVANVDYKVAENSQIYLLGPSADNWNQAGYAWFQSDKVYLGLNKANGTFDKSIYASYSALTGPSNHNIEYGRLAVMNGDSFTGRYHVFFKLDGRVVFGVDQFIEANVIAGGKIHITGDGNFNYLDAYTRETPKEISVSDLKKGGKSVGHTFDVDSSTELTYDNGDHTDNYSLVFNFKYEVKELKENQIHLSCTGRDEIAGQSYKWDYGSSFILNRDGTKLFLGKSTATNGNVTPYEINYSFNVGTTYDVEFGRIALSYNGEFLGKYYFYLKINDALIKSDIMALPQVMAEGNLVFVTADGKNALHDAEYNAAYQTAINGIGAHMKLGFSFNKNGSLYEDVKCSLGVGIDKAIGSSLVAVPYTYGIEVSTSSKTVCYTALEDGDLYYQLIKLGDIIANDERAAEMFTARAYIDVNGLRYYSTEEAEYSVSSLVAHYLTNAATLALTAEQIEALQALQEALA